MKATAGTALSVAAVWACSLGLIGVTLGGGLTGDDAAAANLSEPSSLQDRPVGDTPSAGDSVTAGSAAPVDRSESATAGESVPVQSTETAVLDEAPAPVSIKIPSLGLEADIVPVGVDADGNFEVPTAADVGWYRFGPEPGASGSAVLAAHVDYNGVAGAFYELRLLTVGAQVDIEFSDGSAQRFEVVGQELYDKQGLPRDDLFRRTGTPSLRLATCGGQFDPQARSYLGNRVVTAVPVEAGFDLGG